MAQRGPNAPAEIPRLDLGEVERAQAELLQLCDRLTAEPDAERQAQLVREIGERSERMQRLCDDLEQQASAASRELRGKIVVQLTPDQRRQLHAETGVDLETVDIPDSGALVAAMPQMTREDVMVHARGEAERRKGRAAAQRAARAELERIREELRNAPEQVRAEIERMLEDPAFRRAFEDPAG